MTTLSSGDMVDMCRSEAQRTGQDDFHGFWDRDRLLDSRSGHWGADSIPFRSLSPMAQPKLHGGVEEPPLASESESE